MIHIVLCAFMDIAVSSVISCIDTVLSVFDGPNANFRFSDGMLWRYNHGSTDQLSCLFVKSHRLAEVCMYLWQYRRWGGLL